ncbi:transglycosylase SLT domain-containing protein [Hoeflea sp. YIM 152468]|uniref:transglycosylase SLT domain-containing protein n=1 Tax=Hoeflea sp. YIM 152468 TaxID=3031759 RepID=UPI0023DC545D|nr:transglycosylase SLT domain-containing protein [Hoeflea sp. YIM 152468]
MPAPERSRTADAQPPSPPPAQGRRIAWGARVSPGFKRKTIAVAHRLRMDPDHLMAIMAFETGRSFDPAVTNLAGSGATGLIQFMPATARALGTTTAALAGMTALDQLDYVEKYLAPHAGRIGDLPSAYMAVLYPRAVDKPSGFVLFRKGSKAYKLNRGLDVNSNGQVTKAEAAAKVSALLEEGLRPGLIG